MRPILRQNVNHDLLNQPLLAMRGYSFINMGIIGVGSRGQNIYRIKHQETNKMYTLKVCVLNQFSALHTLKRIMLQRSINSDKFTQIIDIFAPVTENLSKIAIITAYMPFTLKDLSIKIIHLTQEHIQKITYQILVAIKHIQHFNIPKITFAPEDILVDTNFNIKINDFTRSLEIQKKTFSDCLQQTKKIFNDPSNGITYRKKIVNVNYHRKYCKSPQNLLMQQTHRQPSLMWSLGCILAELIAKHEKNSRIFKRMEGSQVLFNAKSCFPDSNFYSKWSMVHQYLEKLGHLAVIPDVDMLLKILELVGTPKDEELEWIQQKSALQYVKSLPKYSRQTKINQIFEYCRPEWQDFINKTLKFDPTKRMKVEDALKHPMFDNIRDESDYDFTGEVEHVSYEPLPSNITYEEIIEKIRDQIMIFSKGFDVKETCMQR